VRKCTGVIRKVTSGGLLTKQAKRKTLYTKNTYIIKFLLNVVTAGIETFVLMRNKHHTTLEPHENPLLKTLLVREENRRLQRNWPIDLI
jgi:hypothetical protein